MYDCRTRISDRLTRALAPSSATPPPLRLQLDPNRPVEPDLDGAFGPTHTSCRPSYHRCSRRCPHTSDRSLSSAITAMPGSRARKTGRGWPRGDLQDFVSPNPPTVIVIADTGRRVTLRVVPPETDVATAAQAMLSPRMPPRRPPQVGESTKARCQPRRVRWKNSLSGFPAARQHRPRAGRADPQVGRQAADQFTDARVQVFVPILVEHIVRGQLSKLRADRDARSTRRTAPSRRFPSR